MCPRQPFPSLTTDWATDDVIPCRDLWAAPYLQEMMPAWRWNLCLPQHENCTSCQVQPRRHLPHMARLNSPRCHMTAAQCGFITSIAIYIRPGPGARKAQLEHRMLILGSLRKLVVPCLIVRHAFAQLNIITLLAAARRSLMIRLTETLLAASGAACCCLRARRMKRWPSRALWCELS